MVTCRSTGPLVTMMENLAGGPDSMVAKRQSINSLSDVVMITSLLSTQRLQVNSAVVKCKAQNVCEKV